MARPSRCHVEDFVALAIRLRPDTALLGVMEKGTGPADDLTAAQATLAIEMKIEILHRMYRAAIYQQTILTSILMMKSCSEDGRFDTMPWWPAAAPLTKAAALF